MLFYHITTKLKSFQINTRVIYLTHLRLAIILLGRKTKEIAFHSFEQRNLAY